VKLQIAGLNTGYDRIVARAARRAQSHWYFAGDAVAGGGRDERPARLHGGQAADRNAGAAPTAAALADPATDLKALLKAA
jgi:3-phenylpropionate/trans-cinnamate dioxygenase ferredoxin reductase component